MDKQERLKLLKESHARVQARIQKGLDEAREKRNEGMDLFYIKLNKGIRGRSIAPSYFPYPTVSVGDERLGGKEGTSIGMEPSMVKEDPVVSGEEEKVRYEVLEGVAMAPTRKVPVCPACGKRFGAGSEGGIFDHTVRAEDVEVIRDKLCESLRLQKESRMADVLHYAVLKGYWGSPDGSLVPCPIYLLPLVRLQLVEEAEK